MGMPIVPQREYLPPTQSQKPKVFSFLIPNSLTFSVFVLIATKCFSTDAGSSNF